MTDSFAQQLLRWYDQHGRKNLPWQKQKSPYFVWLSEVMLQQTQVATVITYFEKFVARFSTLESLAAASLDEVLMYWAGLGYYSRARNLHRSANIIQHHYQGRFPTEAAALEKLPGIGKTTAGAIITQAFNQYGVILDGNVKRVLSRYHAISGLSNNSTTLKTLWQFAIQHTPKKRCADYTQAIMDLGALVCLRTKPLCNKCPLAKSCQAFQLDEIANFPEKKKTKIIPEREAFFLVLLNEKKQILMERQPAPGIWADLWSLPCINTLEESTLWLTKKQRAHAKCLTVVDHRFSHFKLKMKPLLIKYDSVNKQQVADHPMRQWICVNQFDTLALPTPIKKILETARITLV